MKHWLASPPEHPLRATLTTKDWQRIQRAIDAQDDSKITLEEIAAAHDLLYDSMAARLQTHEGILLLH